MNDELNIPQALQEYLTLKRPLDINAMAALKKWTHVILPIVLVGPHKGDCCCCCCHGSEAAERGGVSLSASIDLWINPASYPRPEIVDIYAELSWQAPPGSKVTLEVQHLKADGTVLRDWASLGNAYENLPPTGYRVWDPAMMTGGGYGHRVCLRSKTDTGAVSPAVSRSANQ
jgi:hypothetical protein